MKAEPLSVGKVLSENQRFVVPIYQRTYTWTEKDQLAPLWEQVERKADELLTRGVIAFPHYMGSLLVIPEGEAAFGQVQAYDVVDGQQRITTFHLLFAALRAIAQEKGFDDLLKSIEALLLIPADANSPLHSGRYKLQPTQKDREMFRNLVDLSTPELRHAYTEYFYSGGSLKKTKAPRTLAAYCFFYEQIVDFVDLSSNNAKPRFRAISETVFQSFRLIVITLAKEDDPQVIFETLNTGGKPLAAMDLVRNDVFLRAVRGGENADTLMDKYWSVFQTDFWEELRTQGRLKKPTMDFFLTHALSAEGGKFVSPSEIYSEYKSYARSIPDRKVENELKSILRYVEPYRTLADPGGTTSLDELGTMLEVFDTSTAYPAILLIATSSVDDEVKERLYEVIASYIVRRALCGLTSKNYNIVFGDLTSQFKTFGVSENTFANLVDSRKNNEAARFPTDSEVSECIKFRDQYHNLATNRLRFILSELELASRDKFSATADLKPGLWVEHIMPQSWQTNWPLTSMKPVPEPGSPILDQQLLEEVERRNRIVQTLGNLTLLTPASNSSVGCAAFVDNKPRLMGSLTHMNAQIAQLPKWDEAAILLRSSDLALLAVSIWPAPLTI